jgi:hypothetical protein
MAEQYPVSAIFSPEGWRTPGIAYEDFVRMSTRSRKMFSNRQLEPPIWALNDDLLRKLVVRYAENRAGYRYTQPGSDSERLARAQKTLDASMAERAATLKTLCAECIELRKNRPVDTKRLRNLELQIETLDTTIVANKNIALLATAVVYRYYRIGEDSVGVAQALGIKPPHCRQILWRLRREWERLQKPQVVKATQPNCLVDVQRAAALRCQGLTYAKIDAALGCTNVINALRKAGLWVPTGGQGQLAKQRVKARAEAAIKKAEATLARVYVKHHRERPLTIPRKAGGKYPMMFRGAIKKHVAIFEKLVRDNGGQFPSYRWMNKNGYFTTYMYLRKFPNSFRHLAP